MTWLLMNLWDCSRGNTNVEDARSDSVNVEDASLSLSSTMEYGDRRIVCEEWWPPAGGFYREES